MSMSKGNLCNDWQESVTLKILSQIKIKLEMDFVILYKRFHGKLIALIPKYVIIW